MQLDLLLIRSETCRACAWNTPLPPAAAAGHRCGDAAARADLCLQHSNRISLLPHRHGASRKTCWPPPSRRAPSQATSELLDSERKRSAGANFVQPRRRAGLSSCRQDTPRTDAHAVSSVDQWLLYCRRHGCSGPASRRLGQRPRGGSASGGGGDFDGNDRRCCSARQHLRVIMICSSARAGGCVSQRGAVRRSGAWAGPLQPAAHFNACTRRQQRAAAVAMQGERSCAAAATAAAACPSITTSPPARLHRCLSTACPADVQQGPVHEQLDVAVVGGGPGGLAAAHALLAAR